MAERGFREKFAKRSRGKEGVERERGP